MGYKMSKGDVRAYYLGVVVCIGSFLFGYDTGVVGGSITLSSYRESFGFLDKSTAEVTKVTSLAVGLQQCGSFIGCFAIGPITSYIGRRRAMQLAALVFCIGAAVQTTNSHQLSSFYTGRIISGLGVGSASVLVPLYSSEMAPKELRGRIGSGFQFLFTWGIFVSYWANYGVSVGISDKIDMQWQIPIGIQIIPGAILGIGMFMLPESARWLCMKNRHDEGRRSLQWIRGSHSQEVEDELEEIRMTIEAEAEASRSSLKVELKSRVTLFRLLLSFLIMTIQVCTGANALAYFSPQFFALVAGEGSVNLLLSGIFNAVKVIFCGIFIVFFSERIGRRLAFCGGVLGMSACLLCVAIIMKVHPPPGSGVMDGAGIAVIGLLYLTIAIYNMSWGPLGWIYIAEVLPPRVRDLGVALSLGAQWTFNIIWSSVTPYMINSLGWGTFLFFAVFDILGAAFAWFYVKETLGKSLEAIEIEFHPTGSRFAEEIRNSTELKQDIEHREDL